MQWTVQEAEKARIHHLLSSVEIERVKKIHKKSRDRDKTSGAAPKKKELECLK
jgi:hypothetical protein